MSILADLGNVLSWIIPFLVVLSVVVFVHEMGHFLVARWCGVTVEAFSIGFGPEIVSFTDRHDTKWRIAWIPLGGYVKFKGDENAASVPAQQDVSQLSAEEREGNFHSKPLYQRAAVVAAGPAANFLFAIVVFAFWFMFMGKVIIEPRIGAVEPDSAAQQAGFQVDDVIVDIDGSSIRSFDEVVRIVTLNADTPLAITVMRDGNPVTLTATPRLVERKDPLGSTVKIGLLGIGASARPENRIMERQAPLSAIAQSFSETYFWMQQPFVFIQKLTDGTASGDQVRGVIGIAQLSRDVALNNPLNLIQWIAIISISIGLINLFPIPILDGGHLLFYGIEAIRGRPLSEKTMDIGFRIGFVLVIMLMLFAIRNDVIHLLGQAS